MIEDEFALPPDSALAREMYAHFGLAAYLAQVYEKGLAQLVTFLIYHEKKGEWSNAQYNEEIDKIEKKTLGPLLKRVKAAVTFEPAQLQTLDDAHNKRNFLIHDYFWENATKSTLPEGQREIISELESFQILFQEADRNANLVSKLLWKKAGITEEMIERMMAEMKEQQQRHYPK